MSVTAWPAKSEIFAIWPLNKKFSILSKRKCQLKLVLYTQKKKSLRVRRNENICYWEFKNSFFFFLEFKNSNCIVQKDYKNSNF